MEPHDLADLKRALVIALKKPAPNRIPMSVPEKVRARDYYTTMFEPGGDEGFLVDEVAGDQVRGRWVSFGQAPREATIDLAELASMPLEIRQYLAELELKYSSPRIFVRYHRLRVPRLKLRYERLLNRLYARRMLLRAERTDLLRRLLDYDIKERGRMSVMALMRDLHGERWASHPQALANYRYTELLLESLVQSGDVSNESGYRVEPKAIETLVKHDVEDRRHQDNRRLQRWVVGLTIVLALIGAIQAGAAVLEALSK